MDDTQLNPEDRIALFQQKESGRKTSSCENYLELPHSINTLSGDNDHGA